MYNYPLRLIGLAFMLAGFHSHLFAQNDTLYGASLQPVGRAIRHTNGQLELISSACKASFQFTGSQVVLHFEVKSKYGQGYLQYEWNGKYAGRFKIDSGQQQFTIRVQGKGPQTLTLYKCTEATSGPVLLQYITGQNLLPLSPKPAPLIAFIGNSITCGAAADTTQMGCQQGTYHDHHNAYFAYGPRVARALGAHALLHSVSGIGIYRNWNNEGPAMPQRFGYTSFQDGNHPWPFAGQEPDVLCIALGTNDFSRGDGVTPRSEFDSSRFEQAYVDFISQVRRLHPMVPLVLLTSPMVTGENNALFQRMLGRIQTLAQARMPHHAAITVFSFPPMQAGGCTGHPSVADHGLMADALTPYLRQKLKSGSHQTPRQTRN